MHISYERLVGPEYMTPAMRVTSGNNRDYRPKKPTLKTWIKMLKSQHSPIRSVLYRFYAFNVPSWVAVHFVRHHVGVQFYVKSQRDNKDRDRAPQGELVDMVFDANAQALINVSRARLCNKAAKETRKVMELMQEFLYEGDEYDYALADEMMAPCDWCGQCFEPSPCGRLKE